ncbi:MAG: trypsin-like peptidase domain-containing protein [Symbiobacteriaceae bacterium]|nr:trypsin-like peptidase domain-containing protein [Symbiobacteriaceae bacterium]
MYDNKGQPSEWLPEAKQTVTVSFPLRRIMFLLVVLSLLAGAVGAGATYYVLNSHVTAAPENTWSRSGMLQPVANLANQSLIAALENSQLMDCEKNTIAVVEATLPGVVLVSTTTTTSYSNEVYNWLYGPFGNSGGRQPRIIQGNGSGFVYDLEGHIVTNYHVIEGADTITVTLSNKKAYPATVVGTDKLSDLAVLKIDVPASALTPLPLANSDLVRVGQKAIAIGSPMVSSQDTMGLHNSATVTQGIVSATDRSMPMEDSFLGGNYYVEGLIQTDAAINPGNSGGPLLNSSGEVVGVNTAIISGAEGMGFAIPSSLVQKNVADMIAGRSVGRAYMGIEYRSLDTWKESLGSEFSKLGLTVEEGAWLAKVTEGGPAARAGLRGNTRTVTIEGIGEIDVGGDVITRINGDIVTGSNLPNLLRHYNPDDIILVTFMRDGREMETRLTLGNRPTAD